MATVDCPAGGTEGDAESCQLYSSGSVTCRSSSRPAASVWRWTVAGEIQPPPMVLRYGSARCVLETASARSNPQRACGLVARERFRKRSNVSRAGASPTPCRQAVSSPHTMNSIAYSPKPLTTRLESECDRDAPAPPTSKRSRKRQHLP